ncbi:acyltransferase domain-containing protein [Arthrobacter sp. H5]|uniref:acyltransferase domain-containing protein n=1 Tax=Arthrobacter sp. H5 TaxID=1267973 RepID=UPI000563BA63|nr:acyltransferase domain-containing protein [Arthrobacter sp. H5]
MTAPEILELLDVRDSDVAPAMGLIAGAPSRDAVHALVSLRQRLGSMDEKPQLPEYSETTWTEALLRFAPEVLDHHRELGVSEAVIRDSFADWGRHIALHRRVHGAFGLETWRWLAMHAQGTMFQLGRLQFMLYRPETPLPIQAGGDFVLGIHIPETGKPLDESGVDHSLALAKTFFGTHFPQYNVQHATCVSWMLDPGLAADLPDASNVARFAQRFTLFGESQMNPADALYFVFRTRDVSRIAGLPRTSSVQRAILDRYDSGTPVLGTCGYLVL